MNLRMTMNTPNPAMPCRVCDSESVVAVAHYQPYLDYGTEVYDCAACGCRFTTHEPRAHEQLHAGRSSYDEHARQADKAARYFARTEVGKLRRFLATTEKQRFVLDFIDAHPAIAKIAEIGCSRGALASYFIARGREVCGFDISPTAVAEAHRLFGDHFHVMDDACLQAMGKFDAIYHVGTIGCVDKPIAMTAQLLSALKPGGWLLFNAPAREHLDQTHALWLNTPPPDLVTIFPLRFWQDTFAPSAEVHLSLSYCSGLEALLYQRRAKRRIVPSRNITGGGAPRSSISIAQRFRHLVSAGLRRSLRGFPSSIVNPYGVYVVMQKKGDRPPPNDR